MEPTAAKFDFSEPAELFGGGSWAGRPTTISYRRFETAAEAVRFAMEELDDRARRPCVLEANERRFNHTEISKLYDRRDYPLERLKGKKGEKADAT